MTVSYDSLRNAFENAGQGHVFAHWDSLEPAQQETLLKQAAQIDLEELARLVSEHLGSEEAHGVDLSGLEPAPYVPHPLKGGDTTPWDEARALGVEALKANRVAAFTVAGGQGTRLGYDGPKGTFPATPVTGKTLFQVFAEKILFANDYYGCDIPWLIMTSEINHEATVAHFEENHYFGLKPERVFCFPQGLMPAVDPNGKIILEDRGVIAMSPDGHGGSLRALVRSGAVARLEEEGRDVISYFQVDNPLVKTIDPAFIGFHLKNASQMSSKMIPKAYPKEKVGHFCMQRGKMVVIEYSDLPDELAEQKDENGNLRFLAGSIAIHILDRDFVKQAGGDDATLALPFHRAHKKVKALDASGNSVKPESPNGYKFEMFVFDAIPFAKNPIVIETRREDDFSPVKNAEGVDSPKTAKEDQLREFARWLQAAGEDVETQDGIPSFPLEISQKFAAEEGAFAERWKALPKKPALVEGVVIE